MKSESAFPVLAALAFCLATAPALRAQENAGTQVSMVVDLVSWGSELPGLRLKPEGGSVVTALAFQYGKPVSYQGGNILRIYQDAAAVAEHAAEKEKLLEEAAENNEDELGPAAPRRREAPPPPAAPGATDPATAPVGTEPKPIAVAVLPVSSRRATVLLAPKPDGTYQAHVIDDDPSQLPYGRLRIHNLSQHLVALRCNGKAAKELKTKDTMVVTPQDRQVVYELAYQRDGSWKRQENNLISIREAEQVQLVILRSEAKFFASSDGSRGGFLQTVVLRRHRDRDATP